MILCCALSDLNLFYHPFQGDSNGGVGGGGPANSGKYFLRSGKLRQAQHGLVDGGNHDGQVASAHAMIRDDEPIVIEDDDDVEAGGGQLIQLAPGLVPRPDFGSVGEVIGGAGGDLASSERKRRAELLADVAEKRMLLSRVGGL